MYPRADCLSQKAADSNISRQGKKLSIETTVYNMLSLCLFQDDAVCLGGTRSNMQHTYLLSEVQGKIWMPLIVNVKLKSADSDQVSRSMSA